MLTGTTHPFATMTLLTGGYTDDDGIFRTADGHQRCYVATDAHIDESLIGISSKEFLHTIKVENNVSVHWDSKANVGVIFHILDFLQLGKVCYNSFNIQFSFHMVNLTKTVFKCSYCFVITTATTRLALLLYLHLLLKQENSLMRRLAF